MRHTFLRLLPAFLLAAATLLTGCASAPYIADQGGLRRLSTSDPVEISKRYGVMATLADATWMGEYTAGGGKVMTGRWMVPGAQLRVEELDCFREKCRPEHFDLYFDAANQTLNWHCFGSLTDGAGGCDSSPFYRGKVMPDGSVNFKGTFTISDFVASQDPSTRSIHFYRGPGYYDPRNYRVTSVEEARQKTEQWQQMVAANSRAASRASSEFWGNVGMAVIGGAQAYADAVQQSSSSSYGAPTSGYTPSVTPGGSPTYAPTGSGSRPMQRTESTSQQSRSVAAGVQNVPSNAQQRASSVPKSSAYNASGTTAPAAPLAATRLDSPKPKLTAYPEAIAVCTRPTHPNGDFECLAPAWGAQSGSLRNPSQYLRTPDAWVADAYHGDCQNARRLVSSTHLVWGCGVAATGVGGYMDRSAGVDVKGRKTYYCKENETRCTRTKP